MVMSTTHEIGRTDTVPGASIDRICTGVARG
jgi:hypothetical protein